MLIVDFRGIPAACSALEKGILKEFELDPLGGGKNRLSFKRDTVPLMQ